MFHFGNKKSLSHHRHFPHFIFSANCTSAHGAVSGPLLSVQDWGDDTYEGCRFLGVGGNMFCLCQTKWAPRGCWIDLARLTSLISPPLPNFPPPVFPPICLPGLALHVRQCAQCESHEVGMQWQWRLMPNETTPRTLSTLQSNPLCFITSLGFIFFFLLLTLLKRFWHISHSSLHTKGWEEVKNCPLRWQ